MVHSILAGFSWREIERTNARDEAKANHAERPSVNLIPAAAFDETPIVVERLGSS